MGYLASAACLALSLHMLPL